MSDNKNSNNMEELTLGKVITGLLREWGLRSSNELYDEAGIQHKAYWNKRLDGTLKTSKKEIDTLIEGVTSKGRVKVTNHQKNRLYKAIGLAIPSETFYVPYFESPYFQERPGEFQKLEKLFKRHSSLANNSQLIGLVGMGGIGKTRLAIELAYRFKNLFSDGVFWLDATSNSLAWQTQLAQLAAKVDYLPPDDDLNTPEWEIRRARYMANYLTAHDKVLLILDNVEDPVLIAGALARFIGKGPLNCLIIYTSRIVTGPPNSQVYELKQLDESAALKLLLNDTPRAALLDLVQTAGGIPSDLASARRLCQIVGYLPLALVLLRGVIREDDASLPLADLLVVLKERGVIATIDTQVGEEDEIKRLASREDALLTNPLFITFQLSWEKVKSRDGQRFLKLASFMPEASRIPLWLIGIASGLGANHRGTEPLAKVKQQLQELSLIEDLTKGEIQLHPLIQEFIQGQLQKDSTYTALITNAGEQLANSFENIVKLEELARKYDFLECLARIRLVRKYLARLEPTSSVTGLTRIEKWLDRESHILGDDRLWPLPLSYLFYQQLYNRAVEEELTPLPEPENPPDFWIRQLEPVRSESKALIKIIRGHPQIVRSVLFISGINNIDGFLTGCDDGILRLWETSTGKLLDSYELEKSKIASITFFEKNPKIAVGFESGLVQLLEFDLSLNLQLISSFQAHSAGVTSLVFSPTGTNLLTASADGTVCLWNNQTGNMLFCFKEHSAKVNCVAFSPNGDYFLTGSDDKTSRLYSVSSAGEIMRISNDSEIVYSVTFSPDGKRILTTADDYVIKLWDIKGNYLASYDGHTDWVTSLIFSPDGRTFLSGSHDKTARLWDVAGQCTLARFIGHGSSVFSIAFSPDGSKVLTGGNDKTARLWQSSYRDNKLDSKKIQYKFKRSFTTTVQGERKNTGYVRSAAFSPDGSKLITGAWDYSGVIRNRFQSQGTPSIYLEGHAGYVRCVALSDDGKLALTGSEDTTARLWDARSGECLACFRGHTEAISSVAFSPNAPVVLTGSNDGSAIIWDKITAQPIHQLKDRHEGWVRIAIFSPDGKLVLTGSSASNAVLWDTSTGKPLQLLAGHTQPVTSLAFSPDSKLILTGSDDKLVRLWRVEDGSLLSSLLGHNNTVRYVAFSPDNNYFASCDSIGEVRFWAVDYLTGLNQFLGFYFTGEEIRAIHWVTSAEVVLADRGGPDYKPCFYHLKFRG